MTVKSMRILGLAVAAGLFALPTHASDCSLSGVKLDCGKSDAEIFEALSAAQTAKNLENPLSMLGSFEKPLDLEIFRRSVEQNWRAVNRVERKQRNLLRRRKMSASQFAEWAKTYDAARENYDMALNVYRTLVWHGKTGKAPPKG